MVFSSKILKLNVIEIWYINQLKTFKGRERPIHWPGNDISLSILLKEATGHSSKENFTLTVKCEFLLPVPPLVTPLSTMSSLSDEGTTF